MNPTAVESTNLWPNFLLIGAAKAGTTSLHHMLAQHPEIFLPVEKETHFFDNDEIYAQGIDFYLQHYFRHAENFPARGEATPAYLHWPDVVIPRIQSAFETRPLTFIVMLRDPVKRAWSHYLHMKRIGAESLSFADALACEEERMQRAPRQWHGYYRDGLYAAQLDAWFGHFGQEQFLILTLEEMTADPASLLQKIFQFVGVDKEFVPTPEHQNTAGELRSPLFKKLTALNLPGRETLRKRVPPHVRRQIQVRLRQLNSRPVTDKPSLDPAIASALRSRYLDDICRLETMLTRDFSQWKQSESTRTAGRSNKRF